MKQTEAAESGGVCEEIVARFKTSRIATGAAVCDCDTASHTTRCTGRPLALTSMLQQPVTWVNNSKHSHTPFGHIQCRQSEFKEESDLNQPKRHISLVLFRLVSQCPHCSLAWQTNLVFFFHFLGRTRSLSPLKEKLLLRLPITFFVILLLFFLQTTTLWTTTLASPPWTPRRRARRWPTAWTTWRRKVSQSFHGSGTLEWEQKEEVVVCVASLLM